MLGNFNEESQFILLKSKDEMDELNHPYVGTEHLLLSLLKNNDKISKKLEGYGVTYDTFKMEILTIVGRGSKKNKARKPRTRGHLGRGYCPPFQNRELEPSPLFPQRYKPQNQAKRPLNAL